MFILKKGHQPGVYVPLRALFLVSISFNLLAEQAGLILARNSKDNKACSRANMNIKHEDTIFMCKTDT